MADYSYLRQPVPPETDPEADQILHRIGHDTDPEADKMIVRLASGSSQGARVGGTGNLEVAGPRPWADVRAFGAGLSDPDDPNSDDTPFFQAAINSLVDANNNKVPGTVFVPAGIYPLKPLLHIDRSILLLGADSEASILNLSQTRTFEAGWSNCTLANLALNWAGIAPTGTVFEGNTGQFSHWRFENCVFNKVTLNCVSEAGFSSDITFVGCQFLDVRGNGLKAKELTNLVVDGCLVARCGTDYKTEAEGFKVEACSNVRILNCVARDNLRDGMDIYDSDRVLVANCTFFNNQVNGLESKWQAADPNPPENNIIVNNRAIRNGSIHEVLVNGVLTPKVFGNGMSVNTRHTVVMGNHCEDSMGHGLWVHVGDDAIAPVATEQTIIADNICLKTGARNTTADPSFGIYAGKSKKLIVMGNQCHDSKDYGIWCNTGSEQHVYANNICFGNGIRGLSVDGSHHVLRDNQTQDADGAYIDPDATFIQRNRYGKEEVDPPTTQTQPTLDAWRVGVIVEFQVGNGTPTYWLRIPGDWRQIS